MPTLACIRVYPFKSLDGFELTESGVHPRGALRNDRRFQLIDSDGRVVNGKRTAAMHGIRSEFDNDVTRISLRREGESESQSFDLTHERNELQQWFGRVLGFSVSIQENSHGGFPDDTDAPGPTIVSRESLRQVGEWFGIDDEEVLQRMRANLVIDECPAFWEDQLFSSMGGVPFHIGDVAFCGTNPCARCVVPSRHPANGERIEDFVALFSARRREHLPDWSARERFDHFYRFAVNTRGLGAGTIRVGDRIWC